MSCTPPISEMKPWSTAMKFTNASRGVEFDQIKLCNRPACAPSPGATQKQSHHALTHATKNRNPASVWESKWSPPTHLQTSVTETLPVGHSSAAGLGPGKTWFVETWSWIGLDITKLNSFFFLLICHRWIVKLNSKWRHLNKLKALLKSYQAKS